MLAVMVLIIHRLRCYTAHPIGAKSLRVLLHDDIANRVLLRKHIALPQVNPLIDGALIWTLSNMTNIGRTGEAK